MNRRNDGGLERLHRLARVSDPILQRVVTAYCHPAPGPGRPCRYALDAQVLVLLVKLRLDLPYRTLEAISGIDAVTASRMVRRMLGRLRSVALVNKVSMIGLLPVPVHIGLLFPEL
jgi:hypothetical protein